MAVKIVRQANKIALIGAPTSAGAHALGSERAPAALRNAGLVQKLEAAGYEVTDLGDIEHQLFQPDEESPRARNIAPVIAALTALKPKVEQAAKSGALPLILGGDCTIALATTAGVRRYFRQIALVYVDRDADLNVPATTASGRLDGMVIAHLTGRGAPELVRFWGEPPLVREPDIALFGLDRLDPPEQEFFEQSPMLRYLAAEISSHGAAAVAESVSERLHAGNREFVLHFDVDVIDADEFGACNVPGTGGLRFEEVRQALEVFARQKHLAAFEVTEFNPDKDPDGSKAAALVDLLAGALAARLEALKAAATAEAESEAQKAPEETEAPGTGEAKPELAKLEKTEAKPAFPTVVTAPQEPPEPVAAQAEGQGAGANGLTAEPLPAEPGVGQVFEENATEPVEEEFVPAGESEEQAEAPAAEPETATGEPPTKEHES